MFKRLGLAAALIGALALTPGARAEGDGQEAAEVVEEVVTPQIIAQWEMNLTQIVRECETLIAEDLLPECDRRLTAFEQSLGTSKHPEVVRLKEVLGVRRQLITDSSKMPALDPEDPQPYYQALFKMYLKVPEAYFPYEEVLPQWQAYLLLDSSQSRFKKYKTVRVLTRPADPEDKPLEDLFNRYIQERFLDYGFKLVDLTTTAPQGQRETLVKITLDGNPLEGVADAALGQSHYELTGDITSLRYTGPGGQRLPPRTFKLVEISIDMETARDEAAKKLSPQVAQAVFYLTLKQMFSS